MIRITVIQRAVAKHYGMSLEELLLDSRDRIYSHPRQVAMYLARELSGHSTTVIGSWFHRDHSTVIHGTRSVEARARKSAALRRDLIKLREKLCA